MKPRFMFAWLLAVVAAVAMASFPAAAWAQAPVLSDPQFLPGDRAVDAAVGTQDFARLAAGGGGYLVVWEDQRPILNGYPYTDQPLSGNGIDIYAARLDAAGHPVGAGPIVVSQFGRNQTRPEVAWNEAAQAWLIVWVSERPDWYFFKDIVAARIARDGTLLDPTPIALRPQNPSPANDYARNPTIACDGQNWLVAWEDQVWQSGIGRLNIAARRVAPDGTVLDASPVILYQHPDEVFGPIVPHIAWAGDEYLLVWERAGYYDLYGRRIGANLTPLALQFVITPDGYGPRVAANGNDFLVVSRYDRVHRVTHAGASLDPAGIALDVYPASDYRGPDVAWNGTHWVVAAASPRPYPNGQAIFLSRITTAGVVLTPSAALWPGTADQFVPSIASPGGGISQIVWAERNTALQQKEDIRSTQVDLSGTPATNDAISTGWKRQQRVRFATNGTEHLAVYLSERSGMSRVVAQRLTASGTPLDPEPVELGTAPEMWKIHPDVAWNGNVYLVSWCYNGAVYVRRVSAGGIPIDPAPVLVINDTANTAGAGALGSDFLLAYTHTFSGDQRSLKGVVIRGSDLSVAGPASTIGGDFVEVFPQVRALGARWLVTWVRRPTHDSPASSVHAAFVDPSGVPSPAFGVSGPGYGFEADVAVGNGRAFVVYVDNGTYTDAQIQGRILNADGSFLGSEFILCGAVKHQRFASCGWDGGKFVAAWTDFRMTGVVDQLRGDIYAARVGWDGVLQDPDGFQVTVGALPEDYPAVAGAGGITTIAYAALDGPLADDVQRIGYRLLATSGLTGVESPVPPAGIALRIGPNPFGESVDIEFIGADATLSVPGRAEIFSAEGRRIWSHELAAGDRHLTWDGRDERGHAVPAGVYFARVTRGGETVTSRPMIRLR